MSETAKQPNMPQKTVLVCSLLLGLLVLQHWMPRASKNGLVGTLQEIVAQSRGRNPFVGQAGNGYYENLMDNGGSGAELTPIQWLIRGKLPSKAALHPIYQNADFLGYIGRPNLRDLHPENQNIPEGIFGLTEGPIQTNSYGFFDTEHTLSKPLNTRRIAVLGDSLTRGWGLPINERYTSLLEKHLNEQAGEKIEVLNFAVTAYSMPQIFDVAVEKVPPFHPDVYVLALTGLTGSLDWGSHITKLVRENRDLKYDIFRDLVKKANLRKEDSPELSEWKLAPYRVATLRQLLLLIKSRTDEQSARLIVAFLPGVEDKDVTTLRFRALRKSLQGTGISILDVTDTFNNEDLDALRVNWHDVHPNAIGHRMLADNLYNKMRQQPEVWQEIVGVPSSQGTRSKIAVSILATHSHS